MVQHPCGDRVMSDKPCWFPVLVDDKYLDSLRKDYPETACMFEAVRRRAMATITEIIPEDMPDWAKKAMDEGQFFNVCCEKFKQLDSSGNSESLPLSADEECCERPDECFAPCEEAHKHRLGNSELLEQNIIKLIALHETQLTEPEAFAMVAREAVVRQLKYALEISKP